MLDIQRNYANVETIMSNIKQEFLPESVRNRKDLDIRAGDTVRVNVKIQEKGKTRIQAFEGLVLSCKHGKETGGTFTVLKVSNGIGVERIFPIYSPAIDSIEILRRAKVRRSKLYFLRDVVSKSMRYKLRRITDMGTGTVDLPDWMNDEDETKSDIAPEDMMEEEVAVEETEETEETTEEPASEEASADEDASESSETEGSEEKKETN